MHVLAVTAGLVSVFVSLLASYIVSVIFFPTENLTWALIAVALSAFFSGAATYLAGSRREVKRLNTDA